MTLFLFALAACGDKDTDGSTDDSAAVDMFSQLIYTDTEPAAESGTALTECYGFDGNWASQTPDSNCETEVDFDGEVIDFESDKPVPDATLEFFYSDTMVEGTEDFTTTSDASGIVSGSLRTCTPFTYRVYTDPDLADTKVTIQAHEVRSHATEAVDGVEFNSVSTTTYSIIPSLLGISVDPAAGIIAGTAYGCGGDGDPVEFAQVIVRPAEGGDYYPSQEVRYFREEFPNRDQEWTSEDGLWVAVNIPPGRVTVEMWTWDGSEHVLAGTVDLDVVADSINIANVFTGYEGGVVYPESCLSCE